METEDVQIGGGEAAEDPFEDVPTGVKDVSEGPEEERLGGENPSVEETAEADDPLAEPEPGEFMEDPEEEPVEDDEDAYPHGEGDPTGVGETEDEPTGEGAELASVPEDVPTEAPISAEPSAEQPQEEPPAEEPKKGKGKTTKKSQRSKGDLRCYAILLANSSGNYEDRGTVDAHNEEHALRIAWESIDAKDGTIAAVPKRYFRPRKVTVQPVQQTKFTIE